MEYLFKHDNGILFRKIDAADQGDLIDLKNESWFGTHRVSLVSDASQRRWLLDLIAEDIHVPKNLVLVGSIDLPEISGASVGIFKILNIDWQSRLAAVGWDVYKSYRGRGLGKKLVKAGVDFCFGVLNLHRLNAEILDKNVASYKCALAAGFKKEGFQAKAIRRNGEWLDNLLYGIVAEE
jgi:RimJ/RimL family protein N-acetyltransferase